VKIAIDTFAGMVPRVSPRLLAQNQAQAARNTRLDSGDLVAWRAGVDTPGIVKAGPIQSIYLYDGQYWFHWLQVVDVVRGPIPEDTTQRVYFTGLDKPRFTDNQLALAGESEAYPVNSYALGLPDPATPPGVSVGGTAEEDDPALVETRAYAYTYVSKYGEEGPPSAASEFVEVSPGEYVDLSGFIQPTGEFVVDYYRVYRTISSGAASAFQFVADVPAGNTTFRDEIDSDQLGEILPSEGWIAPPEDMTGLVAMPNGVLAGIAGQDVCISEQYLPHAWPLDYRHTVDAACVGLGVVGNSLVVLTDRSPYVITGANPSSMAMTRIGSDEFACTGSRTIVNLPGVGVTFASPDGLCAITSSGAVNLTRNYLTREQWQAYGATLGVAHEGRYFGFHANGCVVFDPAESDGALYELDLTATGAYRDPVTDTLYLVQGDQIVAWDRGEDAHEPYLWRSKRYQLPMPAVFGCGQVRAEDYSSVTLRIYGDDVLLAEKAVTAAGPFRLPPTRRARAYEIEIEGTSRIYDVQITETQQEIT